MGDSIEPSSSTVSSERADVGAIYTEHAEFVWKSLFRLGVRESDLEDMVQEVFMVVHRRLSSFDGSAKMTTWLFGISMRVASGYHRKAHRRRERPTEIDDESLMAPPEESPEQSAVDQQARVKLERILGEMDMDKRATFVLFELEGASWQDAPSSSKRTHLRPLRARRCVLPGDRVADGRAHRHGVLAVARRSCDLRTRGREDAGWRRSARCPMSDPSRLLDPSSGTSQAARELLASAPKAPALTPEVKARLAARIAQGGAAAAGTTALVWKSLFGAGVVGLATVLFVVVSRKPPQPARPVQAPEFAATAPAAPANVPPVVAVEPVVPTAPSVMPGASDGPAATPEPTHATHPSAGAHAAATNATSVDDELPILTRAQGLIDSDPTAALGLVREHASRFPHGRMVEERERIAIRALARAGRAQEARARGEAFLRRYPDSIYASPVRDLLRTLP